MVRPHCRVVGPASKRAMLFGGGSSGRRGAARRLEMWESGKVAKEGGYVAEKVCCQDWPVLQHPRENPVGHKTQLKRTDDVWGPHCHSLGS